MLSHFVMQAVVLFQAVWADKHLLVEKWQEEIFPLLMLQVHEKMMRFVELLSQKCVLVELVLVELQVLMIEFDFRLTLSVQ